MGNEWGTIWGTKINGERPTGEIPFPIHEGGTKAGTAVKQYGPLEAAPVFIDLEGKMKRNGNHVSKHLGLDPDTTEYPPSRYKYYWQKKCQKTAWIQTYRAQRQGKELHDMKLWEIGAALGIRPETVRQIQERAFRKIRKIMRDPR